MRCSVPLAFTLVVSLSPALASAQGVRELAGAWAQGDYRAPLFCVHEGAAREALRRVRIQPGRPVDPPAILRVAFHDLAAPPGITCTNVSGAEELNVVGVLELTYDGRTRPDTGEVDFRNTLRRDGGFRYRITGGSLRLTPIGPSEPASTDEDFEGGAAEVREVPPGSDAARRLAAFGGERQRELRLTSPGGRQLVFDLVALPR